MQDSWGWTADRECRRHRRARPTIRGTGQRAWYCVPPERFASSAAQVLLALGCEQVDVLGFSMGGTVALQFVLDYPQMTRRLVIAGSGPGFVPDVPPGEVVDATRVWPIATKPVNDDADFLYLFFENTTTSQAAGKAYLARLNARRDAFTRQVGPDAWQAQLRSAQAVGSADRSLLPKLASVRHPVLVANGRRAHV